MPLCKKCQLEEEEVEATHHCPLCNIDLCESHVSLHNAANNLGFQLCKFSLK